MDTYSNLGNSYNEHIYTDNSSKMKFQPNNIISNEISKVKEILELAELEETNLRNELFVYNASQDMQNTKLDNMFWSFELNNYFQQAIEISENKPEKYKKLRNIALTFEYLAAEYARIIISESYLPNSEKVIKPVLTSGVAGGRKFFVKGLLFKFPHDSHNLYNNNLENAAKTQLLELLASDNYQTACLAINDSGSRPLCVPLHAVVKYRGFQLLCVAIVPIKKAEDRNPMPLYGCSDAASGQHVHNKCPELNDLVKKTAQQLHLASHFVDNIELHTAVDLEGHLGTDNRFYLLDFGRAMPPEHPHVTTHLPLPPGHTLFRRLRPEFVKSFVSPLNPDALSGVAKDDVFSAKLLTEATRELLNVRCKLYVQWLLQNIEPSSSSNLANFNTAFSKSVSINISSTGVESVFSAPIDIPSSCHRFGINLRHLGHIRSLLLSKDNTCNATDTAIARTRNLILIEIIARTAKQLLCSLLREAMKSGGPTKQSEVVRSFLNLVTTGGNETEVDNFWGKVMPLNIQKRFGTVALSNDQEVAFHIIKRNLMLISSSQYCPIRTTINNTPELPDPLSIYDIVGKICGMIGIRLSRWSWLEFQAKPFGYLFILSDVSDFYCVMKNMFISEYAAARLQATKALVPTSILNSRTRTRLSRQAIRQFQSCYKSHDNPNSMVAMAQLLMRYAKDVGNPIRRFESLSEAASLFKQANHYSLLTEVASLLGAFFKDDSVENELVTLLHAELAQQAKILSCDCYRHILLSPTESEGSNSNLSHFGLSQSSDTLPLSSSFFEDNYSELINPNLPSNSISAIFKASLPWLKQFASLDCIHSLVSCYQHNNLILRESAIKPEQLVDILSHPNCPPISVLHIYSCVYLDEDGLISIAATFHKQKNSNLQSKLQTFFNSVVEFHFSSLNKKLRLVDDDESYDENLIQHSNMFQLIEVPSMNEGAKTDKSKSWNGLEFFINCFTSLTTLDLTGETTYSEGNWLSFFNFIPKTIQCLILRNCYQIPDRAISRLSKYKLSTLDLGNVLNLSPSTVIHLSQSFSSHLTSLALQMCSLIDDEALFQISQLSHIRILRLNGCYKITDRGLNALCATKSRYRILSLPHPVPFNATTNSYSVSNMSHHLTQHHSSFSAFRYFSSNQYSISSQTIIGLLSHHSSLVELSLTYYNLITDEDIRKIVQVCKQLQRFYLEGCISITNDSLTSLSSLTVLQSLFLDFLPKITETGIIELISRSQSLIYISLHQCYQVSSASISNLRKQNPEITFFT